MKKLFTFFLALAASLGTIFAAEVLSVSEIAAITSQLPSGQTSEEYYQFTGKISSIEGINTQYGNATFYITDGVKKFYCYRIYDYHSTCFTNSNQLHVGDSVVISSKVQNYRGTTPEAVQGRLVYNSGNPLFTLDEKLYYTVRESNPEELKLYYTIDTDTLDIPESVTYKGKEYTVTEIVSGAFYNLQNLTCVVLPRTLQYMPRAFEQCSNIQSLYFNPEKLNKPNTIPFANSKQTLRNVYVGETVSTIPESFFDSLTNISVTINSTAIVSKNYSSSSSIGSIFGSQVTEYIIGENVTSIGDYSFLECTGLTSVTIGNSVTSIGNYAFYGCSGLTSVTIGNSVTSIGEWAFSGCIGLTSVVWNAKNCSSHGSFGSEVESFVFGNEVETIPSYCCSGMTKLTSITIPNSVTSIGGHAFYGCSSLTLVTIPNSVTDIGEAAFSGCSSLASVTIPNSVISIGSGAFSGCSGLTSVTIPNSVISIGSGAFGDCAALTSVTIPNSVTSIGERAFYGCSSLTSITIPNSITSIEDYSFYNCSSLTSVTIPNNVTYIGDYSFLECTGLTSVTIGNSVTSIGNYAFYGCSGLTSVTIGNSVTSIGERAFYSCTGLASVTIPNSVTSIGVCAFSLCTGLTSIDVASDNSNYCSVDGILFNKDKTVLIQCPGTKNGVYTIPNSVTSIGTAAFDGCSGLTSITIPNSVTSIEDYSFSFCSSLTSVTIPNSVTSIGLYAFYACRSLKDLYLGENITWYSNNLFAQCPSLTSIYNYRKIPAKLGKDVFKDVDYYNCTLYVLAGSVDMYKSSGSDWKDFYFIESIGAESVKTEGVVVTPHDNSADFIWPSVSGMVSSELTIETKSGDIVCTLVFNAEGYLTGITFHAPARRDIPQQQSEQVEGFKFTITGLDIATRYDYTILAKDANSKVLAEYHGSFGTTGAPEDTEGIETVINNEVRGTKILRNGQVLIRRGDKLYTMQGQEVE